MEQTVPLSAVNPAASAPALKVVMRRATDLAPYVKNARTHSDAQIEVLVKSLKEFGFANPLLIDGQNGIIAGHGRLKAAQKLGMAEVPCIVLDHMTDAQRRAYVLADNQTALLAGWDDELLKLELGDLNEMGFDLPAIGFSMDEIDDILSDKEPASMEDPEATPELPKVVVSRLGDVWQLGRHRILCGNSTKQDDVIRAVNGVLADTVFTDPPYGVAYSGGSASKSISGDITQTAIPIAFKQAIDNATKGDARLYFCGGSSNVQMYYSLFDSYLRSMPSLIIWDKGSIVLRRNNYHSQFECIFFGWKGAGGSNDHWFGGRTADCASDIWEVKRDPGAKYLHPTQKPVALAKRAISNSCPPDGVVYEPFSGSGSTIIAAEETGRTCTAIEIDPAYVDVAVLRWEAFAGKKAVLESGSRTFESVKAERVEGYNARDDLSKSIDVAYEAVRERQEAGGPGYVPPTADAPKRRGRPPKAVAAE